MLRSITFFTVATSVVNVCVIGVVRVSRRTACALGPVAPGIPSFYVYRMRDRFEMLRLDASMIAAKMVKCCPFGYGSIVQLPRCAMGKDALISAEQDLTISFVIGSPRPIPARIGFFYLCPEPLFESW